MAMEYGSWSGGFTAPNGENTHPYTVESSRPRDMHEAREQSVHAAERNNV